MIKQKAPKDMTVHEFVSLVAKRYLVGNGCNMDAWVNTLRMISEEPAPNPFTEDQIAWMREERRSGFEFAWSDAKGYVWCSVAVPSTEVIVTGGWECAGCHGVGMGSFLRRILSADDPEPLCFCDFAPLDNESTVS